MIRLHLCKAVLPIGKNSVASGRETNYLVGSSKKTSGGLHE
jgi:hypothetical protein